jgi:iron(III) transport system ATP-binding protein
VEADRMIRIRELVKRHGDRAVADHLALRLAPGEAVAIVGPSGSGKTTLLRMIAGLELPDAGEIHLGGRRVDHRDAPHTRGLAFLFQTASLWPHMTVAENILFGLDDLPRARRRTRVDLLLERVGLSGFAGRHPATLSGGEARRVALARALAPRRAILLLDEPTSNLNPELREAIVALVAEERAVHGTTMIVATHEQVDATRLAGRRLILRDGRLAKVEPA